MEWWHATRHRGGDNPLFQTLKKYHFPAYLHRLFLHTQLSSIPTLQTLGGPRVVLSSASYGLPQFISREPIQLKECIRQKMILRECKYFECKRTDFPLNISHDPAAPGGSASYMSDISAATVQRRTSESEHKTGKLSE